MHTVIETEAYLRSAKEAGISALDLATIASIVATNPMVGAVMKETGGARKVRIAGRGKGKSGGYRVITFFGGDDIPVFLLDVYGKDEQDNLSKAARNELRATLPLIAAAYRASVARRVHTLRRQK